MRTFKEMQELATTLPVNKLLDSMIDATIKAEHALESRDGKYFDHTFQEWSTIVGVARAEILRRMAPEKTALDENSFFTRDYSLN